MLHRVSYFSVAKPFSLLSVTSALQVEGIKTNDQQQSNNADISTPPNEPTGPVWTAYSDSYFEGDFAAPFSDLEEEGEGEGETTSSGSGDNASLEDNPAVCTGDAQPTTAVNGVQSRVENKSVADVRAEGGLPTSKSVELESPLSVSSGESPDHLSPRGSQTERSAYIISVLSLACPHIKD